MGLDRFVFSLLFFFLVGCAVPVRPLGEVAWKKEGESAVSLLQKMIRTDTTSSPGAQGGRETVLLLQVKGFLAAQGVESHIYESAPGRGNLIARYRGGGTKKPMMIMAHVDVVNSEPSMWETDPFSGEIRDGFVWGRGAIDDKGMAAVGVQVMTLLGRRRPPLERDVILMLNGDEESGGIYGAKYMRDHYPQEVDCAFILNEGGRISLDAKGQISRVSLQCSEKVYNDVRLWIPGRSGHSSVPLLPNAILDVAGVLSRLKEYQAPIRITPTMASHFTAIAPLAENEAFQNLMEKIGQGDWASAVALAALRPDFNAVLRTTIVPTKIQGGIRVNVLPPHAEVNFNIRLLPGERLSPVLVSLAKEGGLGKIPVYTGKEFKSLSPASLKAPCFIVDTEGVDSPDSPWDHPVVQAVGNILSTRAPQAVLVPVMLTGATDSRFFREIGIPCYGIHPCPIGLTELRTIHNHNERVRVSSVEWGVRWLYDLVLELTQKT